MDETMPKFPMTQKGYEEAKAELEYLIKVKRPEIVARIQEARSHGDLSENAEYSAAREEQTANEATIKDLEMRIQNAEIIKEGEDNSIVRFGATVTVFDVDFEEEAVYTIKGSTEVNPMKNIISNTSPVGEALMGHKKGEVVSVKSPNGDYKLKILKIEI